MRTMTRTETLSRSQLETLSAVPMDADLPAGQLPAALGTPPFVPGPLLNLRDLGLVGNTQIRPGRVFRCATLADDEATRAWLAANVTKVIDLRGDREVVRSPDPAVPGVENVRRGLARKQPRLDLEAFTVDDGSPAWRAQLLAILEIYAPTFRAVLEHVRDSTDPFLFHCTAGRDRTGLVAGMLHYLGGTAEDDVVYDYMLSRIGLEPARGHLELALKAGFSSEDIESAGFRNVAAMRLSFWLAFRDGLHEQHGGWDGYIYSLGFSDEDVQRVKANLRA